jgi:tRNA 5-methylaminomethyl-2-thiouridine biosynthesis bifunctional protein
VSPAPVPYPVTVSPARLAFNAQGQALSPLFDDVYHSAGGAIAQARHVFLGGNGLPARWRKAQNKGERFTIVETGFGMGLNFLATWAAFAGDRDAVRQLHFISAEQHPFSAADLAAAHAHWPELAPLSAELLAQWPMLVTGFHRLHLCRGRITLTLLFGDAARLLPQLDASADAFYLDGFSPDKNPQLWSPAICAELARLAAPQATLATWTVAGSVRSALADAGFAVEKRAGFGTKRQMLTGHFAAAAAPAPAAAPGSVAIIGAGLAGTFCAERLAARGWAVTLIDRHAGPGREASGNPAGLLRPIVNKEDAVNARLSRPALGYALRHFNALVAEGHTLPWQQSGVLQLARDDAEAERFAAIVALHAMPADWVRHVSRQEAADIAGCAVRGAGWWMATAGWASPPALCAANINHQQTPVRLAFSADALRLVKSGEQWRVEGTQGVISETDRVIIASAYDARALLAEAALPLISVRGQLSFVPAAQRSGAPRVPIDGDGVVAPLADGGFFLGATFQIDDAERGLRVEDHAANLARAESLLPGFTAGLVAEELGGRAGFRATTPDRMPIYGELLQQPGVHVAVGLGARGLLWTPLLAEQLASQLSGDPLPVARDLAATFDVRRFREK